MSGSPPGAFMSSPSDGPEASAITRAPGRDGGHLGPVVVSAEGLAAKVAELGARITADYSGLATDRPLVLVGVLKGAFVFLSDLARHLDLPIEIEFMAVSSYGSATRTSGVVRIVKDLDTDLHGRHVLLVEDIIDSGLTLRYLRKNLAVRQPASLEVCALLVRSGQQRDDLSLRYEGFRIPGDFVVGYGLDLDEEYRNLPDVRTYLGPVPQG
ncbi:MAG: hypoxanthine phosphoribosyltransferase [Dermatophilaceae bacterium]